MAKNLGPKAEEILKALIKVVKPRKQGFDLPLEDYILNFVDEFVAYLPAHMKLLFPVGLYLLEFATIIFHKTIKPFTALPPEEQEKYIRGWTESKIPLRRDLIKGVKGLCAAGFYAHPDVQAHIGYDIEAHLKRVNEEGKPANPQAYEYFKKLEEQGTWGPADGRPGRISN